MDRDNSKDNLISSLDLKKKMTNDGVEYWMARDIQTMLGYLTWENFAKVVEKATYACESSGISITSPFGVKIKIRSLKKSIFKCSINFFGEPAASSTKQKDWG